MSHEAAERAYEAGKQNEAEYHGCAQCVLAALQDTFEERDDAVFRAATGLSGGGGLSGEGSCGAYTGATLFLGQLRGRDRDDFSDEAGVRYETSRMVGELRSKVVERYGSVVCGDIQTAMIGRSFNLTDADDVVCFKEAGAHAVHCPEVVGRAAQWTAEIVVENGLAPDDRG